MIMETLNNLTRKLDNSYSENLRIRLTKDSPHYDEIAQVVGNRKSSIEMKRFLNLV